MPSKLKKAIAAVKDQTSISLAMVKTSGRGNGSSWTTSLEVAILKATSHDDSPVAPHHLDDILRLVASSDQASVCARSLGRRVGRTRSWMVGLKCLLVVLRLLQSPSHSTFFSRELLHAMKTGYKILNLNDVPFSSSSSSSSTFVRSFAAFLNARLQAGPPRTGQVLSPALLLDRVPRWQGLLDKSMAMSPSVASTNTSRLVLSALHLVARETFEVYKEVSDGLALLLDGFFHLQHASCVAALEACVKASRQFEQLRQFHQLCLSCGVGSPSDYPEVKNIPDELIHTLQEFLKDQSSFPATSPSSPSRRLPLDFTTDKRGITTNEEEYSDPDMMSPVLSESDTRNYPTRLELLDNEEGVALILGSQGDDEGNESNTIDDGGSGWELALLQNAEMMMMQQQSDNTTEFDFNTNNNNPFLNDLNRDDAASTSNLWVDFSDKPENDHSIAWFNSNANYSTPPDGFQFHGDSSLQVLSPVSAHVPTLDYHHQLVGSNHFTPLPTFKVAQEEQTQRLDLFGLEADSNQLERGRSTTDQQPNVMNQQQMWLQIQTKILNKHLS